MRLILVFRFIGIAVLLQYIPAFASRMLIWNLGRPKFAT